MSFWRSLMRKPGTSKRLIGSITSMSPASANAAAVKRRLATKVLRATASVVPAGGTPANAFRRGTPSVWA